MNITEENLNEIRQQIQLYKKEFKREDKVDLLAVSKKQSIDKIRAAYHSGQKLFGESYVQEAIKKIDCLKDLSDIEWHFIGPIQSNKTKDIARHFNWVHSVDRLKIAHRLNDQRPEGLPALNICLQVNIDEESTKSGFLASEVIEAALTIANMEHLQLRGIMAIPRPSDFFDQQRLAFQKVKSLFKQMQNQHEQIDVLSLGMSNDMRAAIAEGSTMVRIGTAIFGARD